MWILVEVEKEEDVGKHEIERIKLDFVHKKNSPFNGKTKYIGHGNPVEPIV